MRKLHQLQSSNYVFVTVEKMAGSCGRMNIPLRRPRTSDRPSLLKSTPSNDIVPLSISTKRNKAAASVDS
jgi:hypothetical protein